MSCQLSTHVIVFVYWRLCYMYVLKILANFQLTLKIVDHSNWLSGDLDVYWEIKLTFSWLSCVCWKMKLSVDFDVCQGVKLTLRWLIFSLILMHVLKNQTSFQPDLGAYVQQSNQLSAWPWGGLKNQADFQLDLNLCHFHSEKKNQKKHASSVADI